MMAVEVVPLPLSLGKPQPLFAQAAERADPAGHYYSVSADGRRFLLLRPLDPLEEPTTTVHVNWLPKKR